MTLEPEIQNLIDKVRVMIDARFIIENRGTYDTYFLNNTRNEEYVCHTIGEVHRALKAVDSMPERLLNTK